MFKCLLISIQVLIYLNFNINQKYLIFIHRALVLILFFNLKLHIFVAVVKIFKQIKV